MAEVRAGEDGPEAAATPRAARFDAAAATRLRRTYATASVAAQRARVRRRLDVGVGEHVLDLGCGPGLLAAELAVEVGSEGSVSAVDPSGPMRRLATAEAEQQGVGDRVAVLDGDATALPLPDGAVDVAVAVQVLEHVRDPMAALAELHRVLRPGARLVVVDTDWRTCLWHAADRGRMQRVLTAWREHFAHPQLPVELEAALTSVGFADVAIEPLTLLEPRTDGDTYGLGMAGTIAAYVGDHPTVGSEVAAAWRDDVRARAADGSHFFSLTRHLFTANR